MWGRHAGRFTASIPSGRGEADARYVQGSRGTAVVAAGAISSLVLSEDNRTGSSLPPQPSDSLAMRRENNDQKMMSFSTDMPWNSYKDDY